MTAFQAGAGYGDGRPEEARGPAVTVFDHADPASKRIIVGYGFWIFLLSDIVMFSRFFRHLRRPFWRDCRRAEREGFVQSAECRDRDRLPSLVEFHLRLGRRSAPRGAQRPYVLRRHGGDLRARILGSWGSRFYEFVGMIDQGAGPTSARFPSRILHSWSAATACTSPLEPCGCLRWSRRCSPRVIGPTSCAASSASHCSGTPAISVGLRSSPSSIFWEQADEFD